MQVISLDKLNNALTSSDPFIYKTDDIIMLFHSNTDVALDEFIKTLPYYCELKHSCSGSGVCVKCNALHW